MTANNPDNSTEIAAASKNGSTSFTSFTSPVDTIENRKNRRGFDAMYSLTTNGITTKMKVKFMGDCYDYVITQQGCIVEQGGLPSTALTVSRLREIHNRRINAVKTPQKNADRKRRKKTLGWFR
jgi:hypothetical protein